MRVIYARAAAIVRIACIALGIAGCSNNGCSTQVVASSWPPGHGPSRGSLASLIRNRLANLWGEVELSDGRRYAFAAPLPKGTNFYVGKVVTLCAEHSAADDRTHYSVDTFDVRLQK